MPNTIRKRSLTPLVLIAIVSLAPVVLATLAYFLPSLGLRPAESSNYGTLLKQQPVLETAPANFNTLNGEPFDLESLRGKWVLLSVDSGQCDEACVRKLLFCVTRMPAKVRTWTALPAFGWLPMTPP